MGDLKPCPFCGSSVVGQHNDGDYHIIMCAQCGCEISNTNSKKVAPAWNRRATPPEVTALVEASTALRDQIARWHDGGPVAGPDESRALFEALDDALTEWEAANA